MDVLAQTASVAGVLALLAATLWGLRRRGFAVAALPRRKEGKRLQAVERLPLGPQHSLHLVRWGEQALLLSCAPGGCALLATQPWREPASPDEARA